ncbi:MAG: GH116 family glycosyl-hydrolase, partial [Cyanobacteria bacterium P01_H01_bin.130]
MSEIGKGSEKNGLSPDALSPIPGVTIPAIASIYPGTDSTDGSTDGSGAEASDPQFPIGGFGVAWMARSPQGTFTFQTPPSPGQPSSPLTPISGCQFAIFEQVEGEAAIAYGLGTAPEDGTLGQWQWYPREEAQDQVPYQLPSATVHHLYPRTWYRYDGIFQSQMACEQFSPILAGNYQETSYPVGIFEWRFHNPSDRPVTLSVMLSWENLLGSCSSDSPDDPPLTFNATGGNFNRWVEDFFRVGCTLMNAQALGTDGYLAAQQPPPINQGQWAIVTVENPAVEVFYHTQWRPDGDGSDLWGDFATDGSLSDENGETPTAPGERVGAAIAVRFTIRPGRSRTIPFIVSWDLPTSALGTEALGTVPYRATDFFGRDGQSAWYMARTALKHYDAWRTAIDDWQQPILIQTQVPDLWKVNGLNRLGSLAIAFPPWTAANDYHPRGQLWRA